MQCFESTLTLDRPIESGVVGNLDTKKYLLTIIERSSLLCGELQDERHSVILIGAGMICKMSKYS